MISVATGRIGRVVYAQLEREEDLYDALMQLAEEQEIKTGLVLDITGALSKVRVTSKVWRDPDGDRTDPDNIVPGMVEFEGITEVSGHGVIGSAIDSWTAAHSGIEEVAGRPYVHVHVALETAGRVNVGHLIRGCKVRSLHPQSHFTVVVAEVEGVNLEFRCSQETADGYPTGIPLQRLEQL